MDLQEPICIVAKSDSLGIAAATAISASLQFADICYTLHIVQHYTKKALDILSHKEYKNFVLIGCSEVPKELETKKVQILSAIDIYWAAKEISEKAANYAYILIAGVLSQQLDEARPLSLEDTPLRDALKSKQVIIENQPMVLELTEEMILQLKVKQDNLPRKILDVAELLTAAARTEKASLAISAFLGNTAAYDLLTENWLNFRRDVTDVLDWYNRHKDKHMTSNGYHIVSMHEYHAPHVAASLASFLARTAKLDDNTFVLVVVHIPDGRIRLTLRLVGQREDINVFLTLQEITKNLEADIGGNAYAAGGTLPQKHEKEFIEIARKILNKTAIEEPIKFLETPHQGVSVQKSLHVDSSQTSL